MHREAQFRKLAIFHQDRCHTGGFLPMDFLITHREVEGNNLADSIVVVSRLGFESDQVWSPNSVITSCVTWVKGKTSVFYL